MSVDLKLVPEAAELIAEHTKIKRVHEAEVSAILNGRTAVERAEREDRDTLATAVRSEKPIPKLKAPGTKNALAAHEAAERAARDVLAQVETELRELTRTNADAIRDRLRTRLQDTVQGRAVAALDQLEAAVAEVGNITAHLAWIKNPTNNMGITEPRANIGPSPAPAARAWLESVVASRIAESKREREDRLTRERQTLSEEARALRQKERPDWEGIKGFVLLAPYRERIEEKWREEGRTPPPPLTSADFVPGQGSVLPLSPYAGQTQEVAF